MAQSISIGKQDFAFLRENNCFFVDKTNFIKEWWDNVDDITLLTRPRRFGKTLNMSMLNCFFSNKYADRGDLFEGLSIWKEEKYRSLQGKYPVIFLSFADVKQTNYKDAIQKIKNCIVEAYRNFPQLITWDGFSEGERRQIMAVTSEMDDVTAQDALKNLSAWLEHYYGKKAIILLDEYDTPMQEAYVHGYWEQFTAFIRSLFNASFKTNPYLERALMTGVTRVSKESIFSDLNNLRVITTTSDLYADCFGFTEKEVFDALDNYGMGDKKEIVKQWYDGFTFGQYHDIYNPWSITNLETKSMFSGMFRGWFKASHANYNGFVKALLQGSLKEMNIYMNDVALATFSTFDTGKQLSKKSEPERFYHGFVLGLLVELRERYEIKSNRESGYGRYDVMLVPLNESDTAIVIEFKVQDHETEKTLQDTVQMALRQIEDKNYDADLIALGIGSDRIRHYGFAFEGKKVLIG